MLLAKIKTKISGRTVSNKYFFGGALLGQSGNCLQVWKVAAAISGALVWTDASAQYVSATVREYYVHSGKVRSEITDGVRKSFTYYANGDLETITDSRGVVTRFDNYKHGRHQLERRAYGLAEQSTTARLVNDVGCVASETDAEGNTTTFGLDSLCRVISIAYPKLGSASTQIAYARRATAVGYEQTVVRDQLVDVTRFDGFGRVSERVRGRVKQTFEYDTEGRRIFASYPTAQEAQATAGTRYTYDQLGRVASVKHSDGSVRYVRHYADELGLQVVSVQDELGRFTRSKFRAFGSPDNSELIAVSTPEPASDVSIRRNVRGQATRVAQGSYERSYIYDDRFFLTSSISPETGVTNYGRDSAGNMTSKQVGSTAPIKFEYDGNGRLTKENYQDARLNVIHLWYRDGRRKSAVSATSAAHWTYDANGLVTKESTVVDGHEFLTEYSYSSADHLTSIAYPKAGSIVTLAPDEFGRPTKVGDFIRLVKYFPTGVPEKIEYANGVVAVTEVDMRLRPTNLVVAVPGQTPYISRQTSYDSVNNVKKLVDLIDATNSRTYEYDGIDRLVKVTGRVPHAVRYDGVGNIIQQRHEQELNYQYDRATNRLASTSGQRMRSYKYDSMGNIVSDGLSEFIYNAKLQLRCVKCGSPDAVSYEYSPVGTRIARSKGNEKKYDVFGMEGQLILTFNPVENVRSEFFYLNNQKIASISDNAVFETALKLSSTQTKIAAGGTVTLTAQITGGRRTAGMVDFYDAGVFIGSASVINGRATFNTASLRPGYHSFSARYNGDGANETSATTVSLGVESGESLAPIMAIIGGLLLEDE